MTVTVFLSSISIYSYKWLKHAYYSQCINADLVSYNFTILVSPLQYMPLAH